MRKRRKKPLIQEKSRINSLKVAINGLLYTASSQRNFQIELGIMILAISLGYFLKITKIEWMILSLSITIVLICEMINTAIELSIDLSTRKERYRAMLAKDVAAGAVLVSAILSIVIGYLIFLHSSKYVWAKIALRSGLVTVILNRSSREAACRESWYFRCSMIGWESTHLLSGAMALPGVK